MIRRKLICIAGPGRYEQGIGLVETLVAVAILGTTIVALVIGLSAGSVAIGAQDEAVVSQGLAQSQLEYTRSYPYDPLAATYPAIESVEGYDISVGVAAVPDTDADIQKITVTISRAGSDVMTVEGYKVNR